MAGQRQAPNMDLFDTYFRRADLDRDGRISGPEAVAFFQGSNLSQQVLAQIWMHADKNRIGYLGRAEFYNALKLITVAQSGRDLTPEMVKAALFGPASAQIPPPKINFPTGPAGPSNPATSAAPRSSVSPMPSQNIGGRGQQGTPNGSMGQQFFPPQQNHVARPPRPITPSALIRPQQGVPGQGVPGVGTSSRLPSTNITPNGLSGGSVPVGAAAQVINRGIDPSASQDGYGLALGIVPSGQPRPQTNTGFMQPAAPKPHPPTTTSSQVEANDAKALVVSGNGFPSDPVFGDVFSVTSSQPRQEATVSASSTSLPVSSAVVHASSGNQATVLANSRGSSQGTFVQQPLGSQPQQVQPTVRGNHQVPVQNSVAFTAGVSAMPGNVSSGQSQVPWPRMTQSDVQKYTKVFVEVDTDRDGKISGDQARSLFLSWKLPREVLKQVWDLSDQDNDSMLSLREFCIALYLMERFREGRSLPTTFPPGILLDGMSLPTSGQPAGTYNNATWRAPPGPQRPGVIPGSQSSAPTARGRPPRPVTGPLLDEATIQPPQQKATVPSLEVHIVSQLSEGEQNNLKSKFEEATEANKKVEELEKEILDSRKKIDFYQSKMQELILYKSRCDNRLNEITERTSADKREAELLAKKYEEKYKQMGDVASKLTIEEATFRDIQDKKMELYRAIVKMEQDGKGDNLKVQSHQIESELEELVKSLNERCKSYGLRAKPTTLVELPFGWQPGIQEGAADWDENWDKFEDEGFSFVKELTLDVQNVIAPPKPKSTPLSKKPAAKEGVTDDASPDGDKTFAKPNREENHSESPHGKEGTSPPESPSHTSEGPSKTTSGSPSSKNVTDDGSPHATEAHRDTKPEDKGADEQRLGASETKYDSEALWDGGSGPSKVTDHNKFSESFFDSGDLGLPPIRTGSSFDDLFKSKSPFVFADSVPSTPLDNPRNSPPTDTLFEKNTRPVFDSVPGTPQADNLFQNNNSSFFDSVPGTPQSDYLFPQKSSYAFDSVPGTPQSDYLFPQKSSYAFDASVPSTPQSDYLFPLKSSVFDSSVPSTPMGGDNLFQQKGVSAFDSSVPSSPMYNYSNSSRRFSDGGGSDDLGFGNLSRFDSFNMGESSSSSSFSQQRDSSFSRFDSFRSTADSEYGQGFFHQPDTTAAASLSRFDSFNSMADSEAGNHSLFPSREYGRFDSIRSSADDNRHGRFNSFDDADPFGSSGPFQTLETPRKDSDDSWKAF